MNDYEKIEKNVQELGKRVDNLETKTDDQMVCHEVMMVKFENLADELAKHRFGIDKLRNDSSRIQKLEALSETFGIEQRKLILSHEKIEMKMNSVTAYIDGQKKREMEEWSYREKRAIEREKERKNAKQWAVGQLIIIGLFIFSSLGGGIVWVFNVLNSWKGSYEVRYIEDKKETLEKIKIISNSYEKTNDNYIDLLKELRKKDK